VYELLTSLCVDYFGQLAMREACKYVDEKLAVKVMFLKYTFFLKKNYTFVGQLS
jgi:hypothetical protein